ncbi:winged helix-turn-helix domain-containing protein [Actinomadura opuntiae]|uniref:winged helix-turn-helix domain-containing protein n=1 Tax=Actinomadura sp. OS1-43 TaxID=604315 RepID=UPI00255AC8A0|nr:winged helix-turn-helix domain-containing protein [Actinomadura sp. OS1-43]MDL4813389.1 winged helix-turn-helix domain-containing protein [Actinomadura sp. OS1-43]
MGEIDLDGPQPLFEQVAEVIAGRIAKGTYPIGRRIPAVRAIADEFGVSQSTAEAAVRVLRERGLTRATHGRGTFVIAKPSATDQPGD